MSGRKGKPLSVGIEKAGARSVSIAVGSWGSGPQCSVTMRSKAGVQAVFDELVSAAETLNRYLDDPEGFSTAKRPAEDVLVTPWAAEDALVASRATVDVLVASWATEYYQGKTADIEDSTP